MKTNETKIITPITVNYSKVTNVALTDARLSGDALRLLILITNNDNDWNLNITYFTDKLGWSPSKRSRMITQLVETGYLTMTKFSKGYGNGFGYSFEIEPYTQKTEQPIEKEPKPYPNLEEEETFIPNNETSIEINNDEQSFNPETLLTSILNDEQKAKDIIKLIDHNMSFEINYDDIDNLYNTLCRDKTFIKVLDAKGLKLDIEQSGKLYDLKNIINEPELEYN